jgi:hypothetical protein
MKLKGDGDEILYSDFFVNGLLHVAMHLPCIRRLSEVTGLPVRLFMHNFMFPFFSRESMFPVSFTARSQILAFSNSKFRFERQNYKKHMWKLPVRFYLISYKYTQLDEGKRDKVLDCPYTQLKPVWLSNT